MQTNELNLREIRKENEIQVKEIVKELGKSRSHIERIERQPRTARIYELEKYLGLIGYGVDILEFIKQCVNPETKEVLYTQKEIDERIREEQKNTSFYYNENLKLTIANEELKKELEEYKRIILRFTAEKYS